MVMLMVQVQTQVLVGHMKADNGFAISSNVVSKKQNGNRC